MTTIAWDGTTLAGDRQRDIRRTPVAATKIFKLDAPIQVSNLERAQMFGCAGDSAEAVAFRAWVETGAVGRLDVKDIDVVAIDAVGRCWFAGASMIFIPIPLPFWGIGSGADYAMGAMARGATAREAVKIASDFDIGSGMGVDEVTID